MRRADPRSDPSRFPFRRSRIVPVVALLALAVPLGLSAADPAGLAEEPLPEPVPLQRVVVSAERLVAELDRVKRGVLVQLPRAEFEDKVRDAARVELILKDPPRLIEARYRRARLKDGALVGSAEWRVHNPRTGPGIVGVPPLGLALRQEPRWVDGRPGLLGELDGKNLGLLVDQPGERSLFLEWSARGIPTPAGLRFNFEVPPCAVATLELELPRDHRVLVPRDRGLVSGPEPLHLPERDAADLQLWRVALAGRAQGPISLEIHHDRGPTMPVPLVLAGLQTVQELRPGQVEADFTFNLKVLHGGVKELYCECSPGLRPWEVSARHLAGWDFGPLPLRALFGATARPGAPMPLVIRLREPLENGKVTVRCLAPPPIDGRWVSPSLRLLGSVPQGEDLELRIDPELQLDDWRKPDDFRLVKTTFQADGKQVLNLSSGLDGGMAPERPGGQLSPAGPQCKTQQYTWWQVAPERTTLTAVIAYEVSRGRLFRLPVLLPANAEVEEVALKPADMLRHWTPGLDKARPTLLVELERGLGPATPVELKVVVRLPAPRVPSSGTTVAFPDIVPLDARLRVGGGLAIGVPPVYQSKVNAVGGSAPPDDGEGEAGKLLRIRPPWGQALPDYYFPYRGQAVEGNVELRRRPTHFRARAQSDVALVGGRAVVVTRLELAPGVGTPDAIDLFITSRFSGPWDWRVVKGNNHVKRVERLLTPETAQPLAILAGRDPLHLAVLAARPPLRGTWWRLTLAGPLTDELQLQATITLPGRGLAVEPAAGPAVLASPHVLGALALAAACRHDADHGDGDRRWDVPLVAIGGAERQDGQVTLHLTGKELVNVETRGLQEVGAAALEPGGRRPFGLSGASSWRTFRYGPLPVRLTLRGRAPSADHSVEAIDRASLTTYLEPGGRLLHHYRFQIWNWRQQAVPVEFPYLRSALLAVRSDGRWLGRLPGPEDKPISARDLPEKIAGALQARYPGATYLKIEDAAFLEGVPERNKRVWLVTADKRWLEVTVTPGGEIAKEEVKPHFIELPVAGDGPVHRFEMIYASEPQAWNLWARLESPAPGLPVRPLAFRRTWVLPPGMVPLTEAPLQRLPGTATGLAAGRWPRFLVSGPADDRPERQEQLLLEALGRLRRQHPPGKEWALGPVLEAVVFGQPREPVPLVVDTDALAEAGLTPASLLSFAAEAPRRGDTGMTFAGGLVVVPCRSVLLLTTRAQVAAWMSAGAEGQPPGVAFEAPAVEALTFGHDLSGRFRRAADWLQEYANGPVAAGGSLFDTLDDDGSGWELIVGGETAATLVVVRQDAVPIAGLALAGLLGAVVAGLGWSQGERRARRFLLVWLVAAGLALFWLPPALRDLAGWPALAGVLVAVIGCVRLARGRSLPAARSSVLGPAGGALLVLTAVATLAGRAAAPAPTVVYLVPDPGNDADRMTVLVPPELMAELQTLTNRGAAALRGAVLLGAIYEGRTDNQTVQLEARYHVHCFSDAATSLTLPLGGVQLTEAMLDGAVTQPVAVRQPREGYAVEIKGRGSHRIVLRFAVPLVVAGEERDLRCAIPRLAQSRLVLDVPGGAGYLHAVDALGAQRTGPHERGLRLEADLGATDTLRVRWRRDGDQPRPQGVTVEESYYWDLRATSARLLTLLKYRIKRGWGTTFRIDLPPDLEVQSAEAGTLPGEPPAPRLRWSVRAEGGTRRLHLEFLAPVSGGVQVAIEFVPRQAFGRRINLPFPTPLDPPAGPAFLAYRTEGIQEAVAQHNGINDIGPKQMAQAYTDSFAQPWRAVRPDEPGLPSRAFTRDRGGFLHLLLAAPAAPRGGEQDVTWTVGTRQCHLEARAVLKAADAGLSFAEWDVPADLKAVEVAGPQVRSWSRTGARLQIWLHKPVNEVVLTLTGWFARPPTQPGHFDVPTLRIGGRAYPTTLRLIAGDGLALQPGELHNLAARPNAPSAGRDLVYATKEAGDYRGRFLTRPETPRADYFQLTFAEVRDRELWFVATLDCPPTRGERRHLTIALRNWEGSATLENAPHLVGLPKKRPLAAGGAVWSVEVQPNLAQRHQLTLTGRLRLETATEVPMPEVHVEVPGEGRAAVERWLAVAGADLVAEEAVGLASESAGPALFKHWPGEAPRLRRASAAWKVVDDDWRLRLRSRTVTAPAAPVEVYLTEHAAALADGRRWLHQTTYWLYHDPGTDLNAILPPGTKVLALSIDGAPVPPLQPGAERLWLPLTGSAGARVVRLTWAFADGQEPLDRPLLDGPKLEGVADSPAVWTLHVPAGYETSLRDRGTGEPASAAALNLWRAAAQLRLAARLRERGADRSDPAFAPQWLLARQRFERGCRLAEYQMALPAASASSGGPGGQNLGAWLQELRDKYGQLALDPPPNTDKAPGDRRGLSVAPSLQMPFEHGRPYSWQAAAGQPAPRVLLTAQTVSRDRQAFAASTLLLVLLLAVWILGHFFRAAWPEQLALIGCVGLLLFGPVWGVPFLLLPIGAAGYRLVGLGRWTLARAARLLPTHRPAAGN